MKLVCLLIPLFLGCSAAKVVNKPSHFNLTKNTIKIAIIDTGLDLNDYRFKNHLCPDGHKSFVKEGIEDKEGHGTHIAGLIQQYAGDGDYCFLIYKYYSSLSDEENHATNEVLAIREAVKNGAQIINFSSSGPSPMQEEYDEIKKFLDKGGIFVTATGNDSLNIDIKENARFPASYDLPSMIVVENVDHTGKMNIDSNFSKKAVKEIGTDVVSTYPCPLVDKTSCVETMTGSSQSTAIRTGKIVRLKLLMNKSEKL